MQLQFSRQQLATKANSFQPARALQARQASRIQKQGWRRKYWKRMRVSCKAAVSAPGSLSVKIQPLWHSIIASLHFLGRILVEPPGGNPVGVVTWMPGWQNSIARGPRRWLGLVPGRRQAVTVPGAWYTPSGALDFFRRLPAGLWLVLLAYLGVKLWQYAKLRREERDKYVQERTLIAAAKSTDLRMQKTRMLRALGGLPDAQEVGDVLVVDAAEVEWQDPTEWQPATWQQWEDFMQKSRALQLRKEKWWDVEMAEDVPHHKTEHDKLQSSGQLPEFS